MSLYFRPALQKCVESLLYRPRYCFSAASTKRGDGPGQTQSCNLGKAGVLTTMELKAVDCKAQKWLRSIIILQLEKARKRITVAVSGGALEIRVRAQVAETLIVA